MGKKISGSAKSIQLLLLLCFSLSNFLDLAYADLPYKSCSNNSSYSDNSPFKNNLEILMSYLRSNASVSKLYNTSTGNDLDRIYAQYMCLNYAAHDECSTCIKVASQTITRLCPGDKEAVVWEELCQLRCSKVKNPAQFRLVVNETLDNLIEQASFNASANMYATTEVTTDTYTLYALAQCSADLSPYDCNTCLQVSRENISSCCDACRGVRVLSRSCYLWYEFYSFYEGETNSAEKGLHHQQTTNSPCGSTAMIWCCRGSCIRFTQTSPELQSFHRDGLDVQESSFMDFASIGDATNNFSNSNFIGKGGFGPVYKGILSDGKEVAVKRLSPWSEQGIKEFTNEVQVIMKLQHKNLAKLHVICVHGEEKLLVYEFMPNSSLDVLLFDPKKRAQLNWQTRIGIINGIAKGTLYLHEDSRLRIIHRDLKASNVLLDKDMNPKISDFGMARMFAGNEVEANTARIAGTLGYMAPEYAMEGLYSIKSDVFSFGVLLLEIITGKRNSGFKSKHASSLLAYAWSLWNEGDELELIDSLLADSCCSDEFSRYMHVGLLCVQEDFGGRPTMSSVVSMLKNGSSTLPEPELPGFFAWTFTGHHKANASKCSVNGLTISDILPR
ncbi:cysteine-rich receptor protein [Salix suchowensis]|nr:cysteine-rich receptor protein [Salix suchowensis]